MQVVIFRGKKIDDGQWVYGNLVVDTMTGDRMAIIDWADMSEDNKNSGAYVWHNVVPQSVGIYTGMKDKSGKRIYKGDIIKVSDDYDTYGLMAGEVREVYFMEGSFRLKPKNQKYGRGHTMDDDVSNIEVNGNIYENPELLKTN